MFDLHHDAPEREIRFVEVNTLLCEPNNDPLEPVDFGIDTGMESAHKLMVLDVTPQQWEQIRQDTSVLPTGWSVQDMKSFTAKRRRSSKTVRLTRRRPVNIDVTTKRRNLGRDWKRGARSRDGRTAAWDDGERRTLRWPASEFAPSGGHITAGGMNSHPRQMGNFVGSVLTRVSAWLRMDTVPPVVGRPLRSVASGAPRMEAGKS